MTLVISSPFLEKWKKCIIHFLEENYSLLNNIDRPVENVMMCWFFFRGMVNDH